MAEYVRRKRPPATHPYWARLHDRTHPPSGRGASLRLGIFGLLAGISSGHGASVTLYDASLSTTRFGLAFGVLFGLTGLMAVSGEIDRRRPWASLRIVCSETAFTTAAGFVVGLAIFGCFFLLFRYPTSGLGFFYGGFLGAGIGLVLAQAVNLMERRGWWRRQANWPKWSEMARGHRRTLFIINPPAANDGEKHIPNGSF